MAKYLPLLMILGCVAQPDYTSSHNVKYYFEYETSWDAQQIEHQEAFFINNVSKLDGYPLDKVLFSMREVVVLVYPKPLKCDWVAPGAHCNGYQSGHALYLVQLDCVYASALTHEMAHWLQMSIHEGYDPGHTEKLLWDIADLPYGECQ